mmetsp:Transcript_3765/g.11577  ORF Transcript_3765/g.11577 Transcript_3765/m.11577 type:complete len:483 (+) Transcript_3765:598-2046(+)
MLVLAHGHGLRALEAARRAGPHAALRPGHGREPAHDPRQVHLPGFGRLPHAPGQVLHLRQVRGGLLPRRRLRRHPSAAGRRRGGPDAALRMRRRHRLEPGRAEREPHGAERALAAGRHQDVHAHGGRHARDDGRRGVPRHGHLARGPDRGGRPRLGPGAPQLAAALHYAQDQHGPPRGQRGHGRHREVRADGAELPGHRQRAPEVPEPAPEHGWLPALCRPRDNRSEAQQPGPGRLLLRLRRFQRPGGLLGPLDERPGEARGGLRLCGGHLPPLPGPHVLAVRRCHSPRRRGQPAPLLADPRGARRLRPLQQLLPGPVQLRQAARGRAEPRPAGLHCGHVECVVSAARDGGDRVRHVHVRGGAGRDTLRAVLPRARRRQPAGHLPRGRQGRALCARAGARQGPQRAELAARRPRGRGPAGGRLQHCLRVGRAAAPVLGGPARGRRGGGPGARGGLLARLLPHGLLGRVAAAGHAAGRRGGPP